MFATGMEAQQTKKVTRTFFPNPDVEITTPAFQKKHGFTSYSEMMDFLYGLISSRPDLIKLEIVGRTQKNRDIPMIRISRPGNSDKIRVMYLGCVHGNEPAGTEGLLYFMQQLAQNDTVAKLLDKIDFYILPMVNVDGAEINKRATDNNTDLNRNQTLLTIPESYTMQRVASTVRPHVFIDFHEYKPLRASYEDMTGRLITNPNDFMFLWSSHPNVAPSLTKALYDYYLPEARTMAEEARLTNSTYFTTKSDKGDVVFNIGGSSPRSSCNSMALRGAISMLMEVRGIGLGKTSYKRRVYTVYKLAEQFGRTSFDHAAEVRKAVAEAEHDDADLAVTFKSKKKDDYRLEFIDILRCEKINMDVDARIAPEREVVISRPRPKAYYLDASDVKAAETLRRFGIEVEELSKPLTLDLEVYTVGQTNESYEPMGNILPLTVKTTISSKKVELPAGSYRVSMAQPFSTLIGTLLEPELANGFVNYRVIKAKKGEDLTIYREKK